MTSARRERRALQTLLCEWKRISQTCRLTGRGAYQKKSFFKKILQASFIVGKSMLYYLARKQM